MELSRDLGHDERVDHEAIDVFVRVVEAGSFAEAARQLDMPKSTVSLRVASLEKRLGVSLLKRTTRSVRPTESPIERGDDDDPGDWSDGEGW
jgi:molybdenum-dependent DNA-binding transcriptional regulator ModE